MNRNITAKSGELSRKVQRSTGVYLRQPRSRHSQKDNLTQDPNAMETWAEKVKKSKPTSSSQRRVSENTVPSEKATKARAYLAAMLMVYDDSVEYSTPEIHDRKHLSTILEEDEDIETSPVPQSPIEEMDNEEDLELTSRPSSPLSNMSVSYTPDWVTSDSEEEPEEQGGKVVDNYEMDFIPLSSCLLPELSVDVSVDEMEWLDCDAFLMDS